MIDDTQGRTLASASSMEAEMRAASGDKSEKAKQVGGLVAERAKAAASRRWFSTAPDTSTTAALRRLQMAPARAASASRHCSRNETAVRIER